MSTTSTTSTSAGTPGALDALPIRDELRGKSPYGAPQLDVPVRLNTNENPYPLPDALVARIAERVAEAARGLNRYPDRDAVELRTRLAHYLSDTAGHRVGPEQVWAANGSNEVLQQLLQAFGGPGRTALGFDPSYSMHALHGTRHRYRLDLRAAQRGLHHRRRGGPRRHRRAPPRGGVHLLAQQPHRHRRLRGDGAGAVRGRAGGPLGRGEHGALVVVDEAYGEFSHHPSLLPLIEGRPALVLSRTMSKAFGAAGLRLGYLAAAPAVVDAVQLVRLPYHLSAVTQATALAALEHTETLLGYVEQLKAERDRLVSELRSLGCRVTESDANFVQFGHFGDAAGSHAVWEALLAHGVLVRDNGVPGWLRVSAGTPEENDVFLDAVRAVTKELKEKSD